MNENTRVLTEPYVLKDPRETVEPVVIVLERRIGNVAVVVENTLETPSLL